MVFSISGPQLMISDCSHQVPTRSPKEEDGSWNHSNVTPDTRNPIIRDPFQSITKKPKPTKNNETNHRPHLEFYLFTFHLSRIQSPVSVAPIHFIISHCSPPSISLLYVDLSLPLLPPLSLSLPLPTTVLFHLLFKAVIPCEGSHE
jgi:hypothetical protein